MTPDELFPVTQLIYFPMVLVQGGVIQVVINWDCNLDYSVEKCLPEYSFRRLDRGDFKISRGFNFRSADYGYYLRGRILS